MEEVLNDIPPLESVMFDPMHRVNRQPSINLLAGVNHEKAIELFSLFFFTEDILKMISKSTNTYATDSGPDASWKLLFVDGYCSHTSNKFIIKTEQNKIAIFQLGTFSSLSICIRIVWPNSSLRPRYWHAKRAILTKMQDSDEKLNRVGHPWWNGLKPRICKRTIQL